MSPGGVSLLFNFSEKVTQRMSIKNLFGWYYWFHQPYIAHGWVFWVWLGGFVVLIIIGVVTMVVRRQRTEKWHRSVLRRAAALMATMGFLGLVWFFFRQERVAFLAWRFWLLAWGVGFVVWGVKIILYARRRLPQLKLQQTEWQLKEKYLPGRN